MLTDCGTTSMTHSNTKRALNFLTCVYISSSYCTNKWKRSKTGQPEIRKVLYFYICWGMFTLSSVNHEPLKSYLWSLTSDFDDWLAARQRWNYVDSWKSEQVMTWVGRKPGCLWFKNSLTASATTSPISQANSLMSDVPRLYHDTG